MITIRLVFSATLFVLLTSMHSFAGGLDDIVQRLAKEKIAAIDSYLKANPKADDADEALDHLIAAHGMLEDHAAMAALLKKKYDSIVAKGNPDVQAVMGMIVPQYTASLRAIGDKETAKAFLEQVENDFKTHQHSAQIGEYIQQLKSSLGQPAVGDTLAISFKALDGRDVDLAAMKDKVVLVDFWATWCGPCINELPNVQKTYDAYHEKGFEVVAISLDESEAKLKSFIKEHKLAWPQHFDGKGWKNKFARQFGISGIPATFLVGKDGKIVATNLRGAALEAAVKDALK